MTTAWGWHMLLVKSPRLTPLSIPNFLCPSSLWKHISYRATSTALNSRPSSICCPHDQNFPFIKETNFTVSLLYSSHSPLSPRPTFPPPPFRKGQASKTQQPNMTKQDIVRQGKNPWRQDKQQNMRNLQGRLKSHCQESHKDTEGPHWGPGADPCI